MQIDDASLQLIVAKAVVDNLTPEKREALLVEAVKSLIEPPPPRNSYEKAQPAKLQVFFEQAVDIHVQKYIREMLDKDETTRTRIKDVINRAMEKAFADEESRETLAVKMSDQLKNWLAEKRYS